MKDQKKKGDSDMKMKMNALSLILKDVYIPLMESKTEIKHHMTRFNSQIQTSVNQAYGQITINVPEIDAGSHDKIQQVSVSKSECQLTLACLEPQYAEPIVASSGK
jgi:hypothetical protein